MGLHLLLFVFQLNGVVGNDGDSTSGIDSTTVVNSMELFKEMESKYERNKKMKVGFYCSKISRENLNNLTNWKLKSTERKVTDLQIKIMENEAKHTSEIVSLREEKRALHSRVDNIEHVYQLLKGQVDFLNYVLKARINKNEHLKDTFIPEILNTTTDTKNSQNVNQEDKTGSKKDKLQTTSEPTESKNNPIRLLTDGDNKLAPGRTVSKNNDIRRLNNRDDTIVPGLIESRYNQIRLLSDGTIAFCATLHGAVTEPHLAINQTIIYDKLVTNIGNGFHMAHGIFTAPQSGVYILSSSVLSFYNSKVHAAIVINGVPVAQIFLSNYGVSSQGSQTIVIQLGNVDEYAMQIVEVNDVAVMGNMYTSFSGYLLAHI